MIDLDNAQKIDFRLKLKSTGLNRLIGDLFKQVQGKPIQRTYKSALRDCLRIVLINLVSTDGYVSYSRSDHAPEYGLKNYSGSNIRKVADYLKTAGLVENRLGYFSDDPELRKISRMRAIGKLTDLFSEYGINQPEVGSNRKSDLIVLRDVFKQPIRFEDTAFTRSAKGNIQKINELLSGHSIIKGSGNIIHRRALHRVFNIDFEHGGRFYGPEWQSLNGNERLSMQIDRSPVVELDFKALHPTILYALNGLRIEEDPYSLNGYSHNTRNFLKIIMLILINTGDIKRARRTIQGLINKRELKTPSEVTDLKKLLSDFVNKHDAIKNHFSTDTGPKLQRLDSDICETIQLQFWQQDIPVLGVHDSFIIEGKYAKKLRDAMEEVFYNKFKVICEVDQKGRKK